MRRGMVGKENPRQMGDPIRSGTAGTKGGFEASVETFNQTVGLRMESCGGDVGDIEEMSQFFPNGGNKLGPRSEVID
jgi:hypothetical protein